jgi:hypothetical protein
MLTFQGNCGKRSRTLLFAFPIIACLLLLAACRSNQAEQSSAGRKVSASNTIINASAILKHRPFGQAKLVWSPKTHSLTVEISLSGLVPDSVHPAHIHAGTCQTTGKVVYGLNNVVANAAGIATVTTTIPNVADGIPAHGWYLNIHNGPALTSDTQFLPIACSEIQNEHASFKTAQEVQVALTTSPSANQNASGMTELQLAGGKLTVAAAMSGLAPKSVHMMRIYAGTCDHQGKLLYALQPIVADLVGNGRSTTILSGIATIPPSGWYVTVHLGTDVSTQTGADIVACGNVLVTH